MVEERLSVFDDEPDLNDWVEVMCGAAMVVLGVFHLVEPGTLVDPDIMRWFAAAVVAAGAVWAGHGLKDMGVKEVRRSIALLDMVNNDTGVDTGLIRDVLLNQEAYKEFLAVADIQEPYKGKDLEYSQGYSNEYDWKSRTNKGTIYVR